MSDVFTPLIFLRPFVVAYSLARPFLEGCAEGFLSPHVFMLFRIAVLQLVLLPLLLSALFSSSLLFLWASGCRIAFFVAVEHRDGTQLHLSFSGGPRSLPSCSRAFYLFRRTFHPDPLGFFSVVVTLSWSLPFFFFRRLLTPCSFAFPRLSCGCPRPRFPLIFLFSPAVLSRELDASGFFLNMGDSQLSVSHC